MLCHVHILIREWRSLCWKVGSLAWHSLGGRRVAQGWRLAAGICASGVYVKYWRGVGWRLTVEATELATWKIAALNWAPPGVKSGESGKSRCADCACLSLVVRYETRSPAPLAFLLSQLHFLFFTAGVALHCRISCHNVSFNGSRSAHLPAFMPASLSTVNYLNKRRWGNSTPGSPIDLHNIKIFFNSLIYKQILS